MGDYLYGIIDDRFRYLVDIQFMEHKSALNTWTVAEIAMAAYDLHSYAYWVDNGCENKGEFLRNCTSHGIQVINIDPYHAHQNGKIERWWLGVEHHVNS